MPCAADRLVGCNMSFFGMQQEFRWWVLVQSGGGKRLCRVSATVQRSEREAQGHVSM